MLQEQITPRTHAAIHATVVLQDITNVVQSYRVIFIMVLSSVAAYKFHLKTSLHYLAFIAILEAVVFGLLRSVVLQLPSLCLPAITADLDSGTTGTNAGVGKCEWIVERYVAERVQGIGSGFHLSACLPDPGR
jgi:hypothetical protein